MCNRYLSRTWDGRTETVTLDPKAQKAMRLLIRAENRRERRSIELNMARRARKRAGQYADMRGTRTYRLWDEACWLLVRLNDILEMSTPSVYPRLARDEELDDLSLEGLAQHIAEATGLQVLLVDIDEELPPLSSLQPYVSLN